jgi:hypothetical protein
MLPQRSQTPSRETVMEWQTRMRTAFIDGVTEDDMRGVVKALVAKAKSGDMGAIRMLLTYAVGTPASGSADEAIEMPPAPLSLSPTTALPATPDKLATFTERAAKGESLFHPKDAKRSG